MRDRHFPRLCRTCDAPMAGQEDSCWNCGAVWDYRLAARSSLRVIPGAAQPDDAPPEDALPTVGSRTAAAG